MAKYEAMLVFRGDLDEKTAKSSLDELVKIIDSKNMNVESLGLKDLAYEIKYLKKGWYFLLNFETENQEAMNEFRRLSRINKNLLRQLVINLEKDYGYKASVN
ncbi:MAG: 30S ribosomal protein S6, partial [Ureaplasma sp.]|nr:30S ribosomal protein S6 [Ureaplasma sp.]